MAQNMQDIKRRMKSISSTEHITNAMKLVSGAKFRHAKKVFDSTDLQLGAIQKTMEAIFASEGSLPEKYVFREDKGINKTCYILITSSKGLCGGFNGNLFRKAEETVKEDGGPKKAEIFAIGAKGKEHFDHLGYKIIGEYLEPPEKITFAHTKEMTAKVLEKYDAGAFDRIVVIYTRFVNSLEQIPTVKQLLPIEPPELSQFSGVNEDLNEDLGEIEYGPSHKEVVDYMIPKYMEMSLYKAIIESAASEHAARRSAMESATDNAREMLSTLSLNYNRARQQAITDQIIEIVAGSEAQK